MEEKEPVYLRKGEPIAKSPILALGGKQLPKNVKLELTIHSTWTPRPSTMAERAAERFPHTTLSIEIKHKEQVPEKLVEDLLKIARTYHYSQREFYRAVGIHPEIGHSVEEYHDKDGNHVVKIEMKGLFVSTATVGAVIHAIEKYRNILEDSNS